MNDSSSAGLVPINHQRTADVLIDIAQAKVPSNGTTWMAAYVERTNLSHQAVYRVLTQLMRRGLIERTARGNYAVTERGRHALSMGVWPLKKRTMGKILIQQT